MRTQDEIVNRYEERKDGDPLGFEIDEYLVAMDFEHAKPYLVADADPMKWETRTRDPVEKMKEYMPFAIGKAEDQRGISANRSIQHYIAWLWLEGEEELLAKVEQMYETNYHDYGMPILMLIKEHFGWQ